MKNIHVLLEKRFSGYRVQNIAYQTTSYNENKRRIIFSSHDQNPVETSRLKKKKSVGGKVE